MSTYDYTTLTKDVLCDLFTLNPVPVQSLLGRQLKCRTESESKCSESYPILGSLLIAGVLQQAFVLGRHFDMSREKHKTDLQPWLSSSCFRFGVLVVKNKISACRISPLEPTII